MKAGGAEVVSYMSEAAGMVKKDTLCCKYEISSFNLINFTLNAHIFQRIWIILSLVLRTDQSS